MHLSGSAVVAYTDGQIVSNLAYITGGGVLARGRSRLYAANVLLWNNIAFAGYITCSWWWVVVFGVTSTRSHLRGDYSD